MPDETSSTSSTETTTNTAPADTTSATTTTDDLTALFTPEDISARKESVASAAAETERRAGLTDEQRAAEDTAKAADDALNKVPEEYTFSVPEGGQLDTELMAKVVPVFKEAGLTQAKANQLTELFGKEILPTIQKRQEAAWKAEVDGWAETAKKDPEIGGTKFEASVANAARAVNTINPGLTAVLDKYGLGNHPEMIRAFSKVASLLAEDTISTQRKNEQTGKTVAERMFPGLPLR
jgi:hypothetical protein